MTEKREIASNTILPPAVNNWIGGKEISAISGETFAKLSPHSAEVITSVARSQKADVQRAVDAAVAAQDFWAEMPGVKRGEYLHEIVLALKNNAELMARFVCAETGKSFANALGEVNGAIQLGLFYASEGQRLYGHTTTSGVANRFAMTVRQPIGVAGLIIAANTPIANVAWKVFPALVCGNTVVLKAAEDTPATAWLFGKLAKEAGLPDGVLNIIQGLGPEAGEPLVENSQVGVLSFTGSTAVGRRIQQIAGARLARISLELGGKNPFVVCDDADLENAVKWAVLSAFSNAGQRCAAGSRIIVFDAVYEKFKSMLVAATENLKVGPLDSDDFGPVINERQLRNILAGIEAAKKGGAVVLTGGNRLTDEAHKNGFYMAATLLENVSRDDEISDQELFGPVAALYCVNNFDEALALSNCTNYGLTACIHTRDMHRAHVFLNRVQTGVAICNAGTFGSEPHMPFGGRKNSGNGSREPGTEALNIYCELKDIYINIDPSKV